MKQFEKSQNSAPKFVDVWSAQLTTTPERLADLLIMLNDSERQKAQTFKFQTLQERFIMVRAALRQTLTRYLDIEPASLRFETGEYGKPRLACNSLYFNLSHTSDRLLIAVANFPDVGIDIETIAPRDNLDALAKRVFSERELNCWRQLSPGQQLIWFYRLWTKKEAFVKAVGRGIALGMELCEFDIQADGQLLALPAEYGMPSDWQSVELATTGQLCAALVTTHCEYALTQHSLLNI